jgi:hypothetical protein
VRPVQRFIVEVRIGESVVCMLFSFQVAYGFAKAV